MADLKISALPASTTPLAGTEVLPIVQSGSTKQVSIANVTAGRAISATQLTLTTENLIINTAGKGIDFSANTGAAGMTSELLSDYEEGTFTPTISSTSGTITTYAINSAIYTKIGRVVHIVVQFAVSDNGTGAGAIFIQGFPFTNGVATCGTVYNQSTGAIGAVTIGTSATDGYIYKYDGTYPMASGQTLQLNLTHSV